MRTNLRVWAGMIGVAGLALCAAGCATGDRCCDDSATVKMDSACCAASAGKDKAACCDTAAKADEKPATR